MRQKFTHFLFLLTVPIFMVLGGQVFAQSLTATGTNGACPSSASITATASGFAANANMSYRLKDTGTGTFIQPNDGSYQISATFNGLASGTYTVEALDQANNVSANAPPVSVTVSYVPMDLTYTKTNIMCAGASTGEITVSATNGSPAYSYAITAGPVLRPAQPGATFTNLPAGTYTISVSDNCGVTKPLLVTMVEDAVNLNNIQIVGGAYLANADAACSKQFYVYNLSNNGVEGGWSSGRIRISYEYPAGSGNIYGENGVLGAPGLLLVANSENYIGKTPFPASLGTPNAPFNVILTDDCGNVRNMQNNTPPAAVTLDVYSIYCNGNIALMVALMGNACPVGTVTFTNTVNPADVHTFAINSVHKVFINSGLTPGQTYSLTGVDGSNTPFVYTGQITMGNQHTAPVADVQPIFSVQSADACTSTMQPYLYFPSRITGLVTATITAGPAGTVGTTTSHDLSGDFATAILFPTGLPFGNYTISYTSGCQSGTITGNYTRLPYTLTTQQTPSCSGADVTVSVSPTAGNSNGNNYSFYEGSISILPGSASNVGAVLTVSATGTVTFPNLTPGTYNFSFLGCNTITTTATVTLTAQPITIDPGNTGGYVCDTNPATTGTLVIQAASATGSTLYYSINDGVSYGAAGVNVFNNIPYGANGEVLVKVKDDCGNIISYTATLAVAPNAAATGNGQSAPAICVGENLSLNINLIGATSYTWTGPNGFNASVKNPTINGVTAAAQGLYSVTVVTSCGSQVSDVTVTINPAGALVLTSASATTGQTVNINLPITAIQYTTGGGATGVTVAGLPAGVTHTYNAGTGLVEITGTPTVSGPFNYDVTTTGGCSSVTLSGTITVTAAVPATIVLTSAAGSNVQNFCIGSALTPSIVFTTTNATGVTISTGALPTGVTGAFNLGTQTYTISGTPTVTGPFTFELTANGAGGPSAPLTGNSITVKPNSTVVLASGNGQAPCVGSAITNIVFNLTNATGASITTGTLPAGLTGAFNAGTQTYTISGTPTAASALTTYTVTATGECTSATATFNLTVKPSSTIVLASGNAQTPCVGSVISNIVFNLTNATGASITTGTLPAGLTGAFNAGTQTYTISGTPTAAAALTTYTVTATGECAPVTATFSLTVNALPAVPVVSTTAATCAAAGTATINNYVATQTYTFSPAGPSVGAGGVISGMTAGSNYTVSTSNGNCNSAASASFSIAEILPPAVPPMVTTTAATCASAGTATISNYVANNTYTFSPSGPSVSAGGLISGMIPGTSYTVTTNNGSCNSLASTSFSVGAILPTPTASISYNPSEYQAIGTALVIQTGQTGGIYTASPSGLSINATTGQIDLTASTPNQSYTVTYSFSNGSCTGTATTIVKVNGKPATIAYANPAYCAVGTASIIRTGAQSGTYTTSPTGLSINASTGQVNLASSKAGVYTITYNYQDGNITASSTTTITVNALPIVAITTDIATGNSISLGDVVTLTATGGVTYSWAGDDIQSGQNTSVLKVRPKQTTTYKVMVTNANGCSETMEITINIVADRNIIPNNVITPNGDGRNDVWVVKNLDYYPNNTVNIYDRAGRKVYSTKAYKNDWGGTYNGQPLAEGAYVYVIDSGEGIGLLRGTINIIRDQR